MSLKFSRFFSESTISLLISVIIGLLVFSYYFDFSIIQPANTAWLLRNGGDGVQHYLGSYAFRVDSWHFPLTKTVLINNPEGVSIIYTDSNPLLSLIAKVFKGILPPSYQIFGFWFLLCWILQSLFGYLITKKLTGNTVYSLIASFLFCLLPTQIFRIGHANLVGFWLILWTIYVYINDGYSEKKKQKMFFTILVISSLIHAYLTIMCIILVSIWYIRQLWLIYVTHDRLRLKSFLIPAAVYGVVFLILLWVFGYFYNLPKNDGLLGFGTYSMNLLAPYNPFDLSLSSFIAPASINEGQYEGFQYLGAGILIMFGYLTILLVKLEWPLKITPLKIFGLVLLIAFYFFRKEEIFLADKILVVAFIFTYLLLFYCVYILKRTDLSLLIFPATICFILALSNKVVLGTITIFEIPLTGNEFFAPFLRNIRSSGRLFWVTIQVLLVIALFLLYLRSESPKIAVGVLSLIVVIQMADLSRVTYRVDSNNREYNSPLDKESKNMILNAASVKFLNESDLRISEFSLMNNKPVNAFYTAHNPGKLTQEKLEILREGFNFSRQDQDLYLYKISDLPDSIEVELGYKFYGDYYALPPHGYVTPGPSIKTQKVKTGSLSMLVDKIKTTPLVIIAVSDDASLHLQSSFREYFDNMFHTNLKSLEYRNSYLAVFVNGVLHNEQIGKDKAVEFYGRLLDVDTYVKSAGQPFGQQAIISLNGASLAIGKRGISMVSCMQDQGKLRCISTEFDTHAFEYPY